MASLKFLSGMSAFVIVIVLLDLEHWDRRRPVVFFVIEEDDSNTDRKLASVASTRDASSSVSVMVWMGLSLIVIVII